MTSPRYALIGVLLPLCVSACSSPNSPSRLSGVWTLDWQSDARDPISATGQMTLNENNGGLTGDLVSGDQSTCHVEGTPVGNDKVVFDVICQVWADNKRGMVEVRTSLGGTVSSDASEITGHYLGSGEYIDNVTRRQFSMKRK